ncbi:MAG: hypothetical protein GYB36_11605 [Alphaproteobacteria bacterium]|nr:hypothetical protein [Alphaproteobacteria bacterium]
MTGLVLALLTAFAAAALISLFVRQAGLIDKPNHRSSHTAPTPRGGGLGVLAGLFAGLICLAPMADTHQTPLLAIMLAGAGAGTLGLLDDIFILSEKLKFVVLVALSFAVAMLAGPVTHIGLELPWWLGLIGSALFLFTTINAVNFMDGSDGIMAGGMAVAAIGLGLMAMDGLSAASFLLAAAWLGFALLNAPVLGSRGSLFAGDVGALGGAMVFAGLALYWAALEGDGAAWLAALLLLPYLGDVLLTMASRARARRCLFTPHRAHAYQLLIRLGWSHRDVALFWSGLCALCAALAIWGQMFSSPGRIGVFWLGVAGFTVFHQIVRRSARKAGLDTTQ